jgi:hypothetical protein
VTQAGFLLAHSKSVGPVIRLVRAVVVDALELRRPVLRQELRKAYVQPRLPVGIGPVGTPVQLILFNKGLVQASKIPWDEIGPVEIGRIVSQLAIEDFRKTPSVLQQQRTIGWGFGALLAFVCNGEPQLIVTAPSI